MIRSKMKQLIYQKCQDCSHDPIIGSPSHCAALCIDKTCPLWGVRPRARLDTDFAHEYVDGKWQESKLTPEELAMKEKRIQQGKELYKKTIGITD